MYISPIELKYTEPILSEIRDKQDAIVVQMVQSVDATVDRDELIKMMQYDRGQYDSGYSDGLKEGYKNAKAEMKAALDKILEGI